MTIGLLLSSMFMDFNIENFMEKELGQASIMVSAYFDWHVVLQPYGP